MTLLRDLMLADLERGLAIARDGHEVVPAWRILAPDGDFLILTQFDPDKPEQRERVFSLVPRFMAWKLATGFVLTAETWLGPERTRSGEEAVLTIGVSHHERMAVIRRIRRTPALAFGPAEWLPADALDDTYFRVLPSGQSTVTAEEAAMLAAVFAEDGELPARSASDFGNWGCAPRPSCNGVNNRGPTNLQTEGMPMSSDLSAQRWFVSGSALIGCATGYLLAFSRSPVVGVALPLIFGLAGSAGSIYIAKADLTSAKDRCNKAEAASGWPLSNSTCA